jgi:hypothetical protein
MSARYFLPDHPKLTDVYSKGELRAMLQAGQLSRSDMVTDDETGKGYLLGDLLMMPFPDVAVVPLRSTNSLQTGPPPRTHEFRADTPLPRVEREELDDEDGEEEEEFEGDEDEFHNASRSEEETQEEGDEDQEQEQEALPPPQRKKGRPAARNVPEAPAEDADEDAESEGDDEELLYVGHPSWLAFRRSLLVAAVCIGSAVFFLQHNVGFEWITLPGSIAGLIFLFIGLDRATTTYLVTTKRVEMEFGILGRNSKEVRICDIRAIDVVQRGFDAVVGLGTVKFDSSASAGPEVCFRNVRKAHQIKQLVRELQG